MKKLYTILLSGMVLLLLPNCGNNNNSTPQPGAPTMSAQCAQMSYAVPGQPCSFPYSNYQGFSNSYGTSSFGYTGVASGGCGASQLTGQPMYPVYSASKGMGCVDVSQAGWTGTQPIAYANQGGTYIPVPYQYGTTYRACDAVDQCAAGNRCLSPFAPAGTPGYYGSMPVNTNGLGICFN